MKQLRKNGVPWVVCMLALLLTWQEGLQWVEARALSEALRCFERGAGVKWSTVPGEFLLCAGLLRGTVCRLPGRDDGHEAAGARCRGLGHQGLPNIESDVQGSK